MNKPSKATECLPVDYYTALVVLQEEFNRRLDVLHSEVQHQPERSGIQGIIRANRFLLEAVRSEREGVHALLADALPHFD